MNAQLIVSTALKYKGEMETPNNSGFKNSDFQKRMKDVGWDKGLAWCSFFGELVWKEAYSQNKDFVKLLDTLFSGSATTTFKNFDMNQIFTTNKTPSLGSIVVWRFGSGWKGHLGIVTRLHDVKTEFVSIEGNTNDKGGREGYIVAERLRRTNTPYSEKGLNLVGFIHPVTF